jgi:ATP/maltotriose-dependent transcriptional regulator MalT
MSGEIDAFSLVCIKLQRPRPPGDQVPWRWLLDRLHDASDRKLTLISTMAGAGKTTLLTQWLEECPQPSVWLSLDERDNELDVFLSYLVGGVRTVSFDSCVNTLDTEPAIHGQIFPLLSIFAHGLSASPGIKLYAQQVAWLSADALPLNLRQCLRCQTPEREKVGK